MLQSEPETLQPQLSQVNLEDPEVLNELQLWVGPYLLEESHSNVYLLK